MFLYGISPCDFFFLYHVTTVCEINFLFSIKALNQSNINTEVSFLNSYSCGFNIFHVQNIVQYLRFCAVLTSQGGLTVDICIQKNVDVKILIQFSQATENKNKAVPMLLLTAHVWA